MGLETDYHERTIDDHIDDFEWCECNPEHLIVDEDF